MTTQRQDLEESIRELQLAIVRIETIIPTLATKEDQERLRAELERFRGELETLRARLDQFSTKEDVERLRADLTARLERIEAIIPTLATKEDLERQKFTLLTAFAGMLTIAVTAMAILYRVLG